jgi:predicted secreted acid phosphatase
MLKFCPCSMARPLGGLLWVALLVIAAATPSSAAWNCADKDKHGIDLAQPLNLGQLKVQLRDYRYCGAYDADFAARIAEAIGYLKQHGSDEPNPAVVLDIDETSLSNWQEIEQDDFGYIPGGPCTLDAGIGCGDAAWELRAEATALEPTLELFNVARSMKIPVFFITGRRDKAELRAATIKNLKTVGYDGWQDLIMRPLDSQGPVAPYKSAEREKIEKTYKIILNVGDQQSDLDGGFAKKTVRVPNPFYFIP